MITRKNHFHSIPGSSAMKSRIGLAIGLWCVILFLGSGCSTLQCKVVSNTSWSGPVGNSTKSGTGNASFDISSGDGAVIQKETTSGTLTVKIVSDGIFGESVIDEGTTTAAYGIVSVIDKSGY
jgi:hypothetical protein